MSRGRFRDLEHEAENIKRPEVVIFHALPQKLRGDWLSVVHPTLRWVLSDDTIDDDDFFPVLKISKSVRALGGV